MGESIIDLLGPPRGEKGSIVATIEGGTIHCGFEYNSGRVHFVAKLSGVYTHLWYQIEL